MTKNIVITGASSGIGAALTHALARDGHRLFVCARRADRLAEVTENGKLAVFSAVDVAKDGDMAGFAALVGKEVEKVDALICCAGAYGPIGPAHEISGDAWMMALSANLFGTFLAARHFIPLMPKHAGARIITFSGGGAFNPLPHYSAYAVSKAGVVRLSETLAEELKPLGIAVNGVAPGFVQTEIHDATLAAGPAKAGTEFYAATQAKLQEGGVPMEIPIGCVRFLLSSASDGLTGKTISAGFDPWRDPEFAQNIAAVNASELYTMRRINIVNLPTDPAAILLSKVRKHT